MKSISSITVRDQSARLFVREGDYTLPQDLDLAQFQGTPLAAAWTGAMGWFSTQGLRPGEMLCGPIVLDVRRLAAIDVPGTETVTDTHRHILIASGPVMDAEGRRREATSTTEDMPAELRAAFLTLFDSVENLINS